MPDMFWYIWCAVGIPWGLITLVLIPQKNEHKRSIYICRKEFYQQRY